MNDISEVLTSLVEALEQQGSRIDDLQKRVLELGGHVTELFESQNLWHLNTEEIEKVQKDVQTKVEDEAKRLTTALGAILTMGEKLDALWINDDAMTALSRSYDGLQNRLHQQYSELDKRISAVGERVRALEVAREVEPVAEVQEAPLPEPGTFFTEQLRARIDAMSRGGPDPGPDILAEAVPEVVEAWEAVDDPGPLAPLTEQPGMTTPDEVIAKMSPDLFPPPSDDAWEEAQEPDVLAEAVPEEVGVLAEKFPEFTIVRIPNGGLGLMVPDDEGLVGMVDVEEWEVTDGKVSPVREATHPLNTLEVLIEGEPNG